MSKHNSALMNKLYNRFVALETTRNKIESLYVSKLIRRQDLERMYEGLFLSAVVAFENFVEDLFFNLLLTKKPVISRKIAIPRIVVKSRKIAREIILGVKSKKYIDWLPYSRTLERAKIYFRNGKPFSELSDFQMQHIQKCYCIRNAIAHRSKYSTEQFRRLVLSSQPIPLQERTPAGYLHGLFRSSPNQTRYENYVAQLLLIARHLAR